MFEKNMNYCTRDAKGRFAPLMTYEQLETYNIYDIILDEMEKNTKKKARLSYYES